MEIPPPQLQFLKDLYYSTCYPSSKETPIFNLTIDDDYVDLNRHWTRTDYVGGKYMAYGKNINPNFRFRHVYSTNGTERDADTIPFCDWMFKRGLNVTTNSWDDPGGATACVDWEGVLCDQEGNIVELQLARKALAGRIPSSISELRFLQKLDLSYNRLSGEVPSEIFASAEIKEILLSHNLFDGEIPCMRHPEPKLVELVLSQNFLS